MDQVKGRAKEAVGVVTGDKSLEREGKIQRAAGDIEEKAEELAEQHSPRARVRSGSEASSS